MPILGYCSSLTRQRNSKPLVAVRLLVSQQSASHRTRQGECRGDGKLPCPNHHQGIAVHHPANGTRFRLLPVASRKTTHHDHVHGKHGAPHQKIRNLSERALLIHPIRNPARSVRPPNGDLMSGFPNLTDSCRPIVETLPARKRFIFNYLHLHFTACR